ncbi:twin-arginine translocation signal domain-containing protein [Streptomyces sp. NRRL F-5126]|uniref:twin-arginine translocation signal domain-containing protein n=1 Tax=Streptomyces sp. NRRL F-5126 TaxID=1463857 RepID=UPI0004C83DBB|nr:twin-arginine translocation signal domain-containing protein [Streptomyces sp. NRRL F-5126]
MRSISRRDLLGAGAGAAAAVGLAACGAEKAGGHKASAEATGKGAVGKGNAAGPPQRPMKLIGDGSTAYTGKQPNQPAAPVRLEPGQTPPQFVIFSWDGAGEVGTGLFDRFLDLAKQHDAGMTFFLSGLYLLPESKKDLYHPPNNPVGASAIGYLSDEHIKETLACVRRAWNEGHEIGTHYNGHFCSGSGSVGNWTSADWRSEIDQAVDFVTKWRTNCSTPDADPLPFDYRKELVGSRTPCLLGQKQLLPTAAALGWRYDASSPGGLQIWPTKKVGLWDFPLQGIPFPGHTFEVLSMDYNILANQSKNSTHGMTSKYPAWRKQATESYMAGFKRAYETNRAPFFIGNHMETWNGGIYMDAVEDALKQIAGAGHKDVRLVSFRQFADWLDVQDPAILGKLQSLNVGEQPAGGWNSYLKAA